MRDMRRGQKRKKELKHQTFSSTSPKIKERGVEERCRTETAGVDG